MFNKLAVIGLGSLGGFLCKHLSELQQTEDLIIIDHDVVKRHNVFTSIYNSSQIDEYKVDALELLLNNETNIIKVNRYFIEGVTIIPYCDLLIDCRDIVCSRKNLIDVRFSISGENLIVDCRKGTDIENEYEGFYSVPLTKSEINRAAFYAAQLVENNRLEKMMKNGVIHSIDLNYIANSTDKAMKEYLDNKIDLVYDDPDVSPRLKNIVTNINPILKINKTQHLDVYVNQHKTPPNIIQKLFNKFPDVAETRYQVIPMSSLNTSRDVMVKLSQIIRAQPRKSNFIVTLNIEGGRPFIRLLEETGGA